MFFGIALHVLTFLVVLQSLFKQVSVLTCTEDFECYQNASSICCSGSCKAWWNCKGGCVSDDSCEGEEICFRSRCQDQDIDFPAYCSSDTDCIEEEECESGQCKPPPRPVAPDNSDEVQLQVSFHFDPRNVIIVGSSVGAVIFLAVVVYISYRCRKRHIRRRFSRGTYSAPTNLGHGVSSFSSPRSEVETIALYRQQNRVRLTSSGSSGFSYPQGPPPEYDSLTLDSNLEVESSSPPPYDPADRTLSRTSFEEAQVGENFCFDISLKYLVLIYWQVWQAWQAGKMNQILCCDWLPKEGKMAYVLFSPRKRCSLSHMISTFLTKLVLSRWPDIGLIFCLSVYGT